MSAQNSGKPLGGRGSALNPSEGAHIAPHTPSLVGRGCCPPHELPALGLWSFVLTAMKYPGHAVVYSDQMCVLCRRAGRPSDESAVKMYCVDCCETMCKPCAVSHRQNASSAGHELVKLHKRRPSRPEKFLSKIPAVPCQRHPDEPQVQLTALCNNVHRYVKTLLR